MRTIKFRAWDSFSRKMWFPSAISADGRNVALVSQFGVQSEDRQKDVLMQFTGLLDKNGKEIYEGDIIRHHKYGGIWEVIWHEDSVGFFLEGELPMALSKLCQPLIEIIGNIYSNPELIKVLEK